MLATGWGKRAVLVVAVLALAACGGKGASSPGSGGSPEDKSSGRSKGDSDDTERMREMMKREADAQLKQISGALDSIEKELVHVLSRMLAQEPYDRGKSKIAMSTCISTLRKVGMKVTIVPITDVKGAFTLDDKAIKAFYTKRKKRLEPPEQEAFDALTYMLGNFSAMIQQAQQFAMMTHIMVVSHAAGVAAVDASGGTPPNDVDIEVVRKSMVEERRAETMGAASAGIGAAIQAILDKEKDPKALDEIAKAFISATPIKASVSAAEAKSFLDGFQGGLGDTQARYAAMLDQYMPGWKDMDIGRYFKETFKAAEDAGKQKARTADRGSSSKRDDSGGKTADKSGDAASTANSALSTASKLANDDRIKHGLQAYEALRKGDAKGTATAAMTFVPDGPVKNGLGLVLKLF